MDMEKIEQKLIPILNSLDETSEEYPFHAREQVLDELDKSKNLPEENLDILENIAKNAEYAIRIRFNALYCLLAKVWHEGDYSKYKYLINKYLRDLESYSQIYKFTFKSQYYLKCLEPNSINYQKSLQLAMEAIETSKRLQKKLPNVLHLYTVIAVHMLDKLGHNIDVNILTLAEKNIDDAINLKRKYALYYATKAELLGKVGRFEEAKSLIQRAIAIEPRNGSGHDLRVGHFQDIRVKIHFQELETKNEQNNKIIDNKLDLKIDKFRHIFEQQQQESFKKLDEVRLKVFELLGLLSAIIAFLVTSFKVSDSSLVFDEAARLLVITGGMILTIFSSYSMIFLGVEKNRYQVKVLLFGLLIVFIASFSEIIQSIVLPLLKMVKIVP